VVVLLSLYLSLSSLRLLLFLLFTYGRCSSFDKDWSSGSIIPSTAVTDGFFE
jgi:hypothetical protein